LASTSSFNRFYRKGSVSNKLIALIEVKILCLKKILTYLSFIVDTEKPHAIKSYDLLG